MIERGTLPRQVRLAILDHASGGGALPEPYNSLVAAVGEDSFRVTDAQVHSVVQETGSQRQAFEVILTAAVGAGLRRWDAAQQAIEQARHAAS